MIEVFDQERNRTAILDNAYDIQEDKKLNALCYFAFTLPYNDPKNEYCQPYHYVRHDGGELYRIMPSTMSIEETGGVIYQCEHVLATLLDNVLYGYHVIGNIGVYTDDVIRYILARQKTENWVLNSCDFRYQFEYGFENENLLSALFSVFAPFAEPCKLETNTKTYPWRLSIKRLQTTGVPDRYVRYRHNMTRFQQNQDPERVCTRLYPLGYGEGINQLTIKDVNGGVPYLQSPPEIIAKYGLVEKVWIDRRYADAETLKAVAASILRNIQTPEVSYEIECIDGAEPGQRIRIIYPDSKGYIDTYITKVTKKFDDIAQSSITVSKRDVSISQRISDLAEKQWIAENYAQGATNVYCQSLQANCDGNNAATLNFIIPAELKIVNKVFAKIRIKPFRAYSKTTENYNYGARYTKYSEYMHDLESSSFTDPSTTTGYDQYDDSYAMNHNYNDVLTQGMLYGANYVDASFFPGSVLPDAFVPDSMPPQIIGPHVLRCKAVKSTYTPPQLGTTTHPSLLGKEYTQLTSDISKTSTILNVLSTADCPKAPNYVEVGSPSRYETIYYKGKDRTSLSRCERGGTPRNWPRGTYLYPLGTMKDYWDGSSSTPTIPGYWNYEFIVTAHHHVYNATEHVHTFTYPAHNHEFNLPSHTHDIAPGIYEFGNPQSFSIMIDGVKKKTYAQKTAELDITDFLLGTDGKIPRGKWFEFGVLPDGLAYASITLVVQGFVQSRGNVNA